MIKKNNNTNREREWKFTIYISIIKRLFQARKLNNCEWERIDYTHKHSHTHTLKHPPNIRALLAFCLKSWEFIAPGE